MMSDFFHSPDGLGPFGTKPDVDIHDNELRAIHFPDVASGWDTSNATRIYFVGDHHAEKKDINYIPLSELQAALDSDPGVPLFVGGQQVRTDVVIKRILTWAWIESYIRTWSPLHAYQLKHPDDKERTGRGKDGDIVDRFIEELKARLPENKESVDVEWTMYLMMIKNTA